MSTKDIHTLCQIILSNMVQGNGLKGGIVYFDTFAFSQVFREWKGEQL